MMKHAGATMEADPAGVSRRPPWKVRAKEVGGQKYACYYGLVRRRAGDVFELADPAHFSSTSMEWVDPSTPKTTAPGEATPEELGYDHEPATLRGAQERNRVPALKGKKTK